MNKWYVPSINTHKYYRGLTKIPCIEIVCVLQYFEVNYQVSIRGSDEYEFICFSVYNSIVEIGKKILAKNCEVSYVKVK